MGYEFLLHTPYRALCGSTARRFLFATGTSVPSAWRGILFAAGLALPGSRRFCVRERWSVRRRFGAQNRARGLVPRARCLVCVLPVLTGI